MNGIFRGKNLGTISSLNEYIAFRTEHGIDTKEYKDIYLGDTIKIVDGTYNIDWMVAHFDYYYNKGTSVQGPASYGIVLIPVTNCGDIKMNATESKATGAYKLSLANSTHCPAVADALQRVLGTYLLNTGKFISSSISESIPSMAGGGWTGGSSSREWVQNRCILPSEIQIYGSNVCSSSMFDIGEADQQLAVFNFINHTQDGRLNFWLRNVASSTSFGYAEGSGVAGNMGANTDEGLRPLIYIG